jgi:transposase
MAGKTSSMITIKQLLIMYDQGRGIKTIARDLGMSKNTVKGYLQKLDILLNKGDHSLSIPAMIQMPDPQLEALFHAGNPAYKEGRYAYVKARAAYYKKELDRTGVNRITLWQEYRLEQPDGYSYTQFCFHLQQLLQTQRPSMVLQHKPGDKLFIDFAGEKLSYTDRNTGEVVSVEVFVACLPFSDYSFVMAVPSQSSANFIHALASCLHALGGVPQAIVSDNLKSAVTRSSHYEPDINKVLQDLANHYGTTILPARAYKPKDKALVENQVGLIYTRVYARLRNLQFFDLHTLNKAIEGYVLAHNQTRMQQKPYSREERFIAEEKSHLLPLPQQKFEVKHYRELKVATNNHVYLSEDKHYYSVPYQHIGSKVKVIYTRTLVHIYHQGTQIAAHIRNYQLGGYTTDKSHLCSHHQHYLNRSPQYYLQIAQKKCPDLHRLFECIFRQNRYPEQLYKTCDGLLGLQRKTETEKFASACRMAIEYEQYNYRFVQKILQNNMANESQPPPGHPQPLPTHPNIRGKSYYQQSFHFPTS